MFRYSNGVRFLTQVTKAPNVEELSINEKEKYKHKYKSNSELTASILLEKEGIDFEYETMKLDYGGVKTKHTHLTLYCPIKLYWK